MNAPLPLRLGVALLLATTSLPLPAADVPPLISQPPAKTVLPKPVETPEQKAARHAQEVKQVEAQINAAVREFPLLTGPGWEEKFGKFHAEIRVLHRLPEFKRPSISPVVLQPGQRPLPKPAAQVLKERQGADLAIMRRQAQRVAEQHPDLREYADQQFRWHQKMYELAGLHPDNPKVRQLVVNRLAVVAVPEAVAKGAGPAPGK